MNNSKETFKCYEKIRKELVNKDIEAVMRVIALRYKFPLGA